ncbi:MAG: AAA family ATPase [Thermogemmatispora sp.]|nr:AAA family ATPase [Thermogemmatispora sp.]
MLVGSNGAGKTNVFRALKCVQGALALDQSQAATRWEHAGYQGAEAQTIEITLEIELNTVQEQDWCVRFFAAVLCDQSSIDEALKARQRSATPAGLKRFDAWIQQQLSRNWLTWFYRGRLVLTYDGQWGWRCRYEAPRQGALSFRLDLSQGGILYGGASPTSTPVASLFTAWVTQLESAEQEELLTMLSGTGGGESFPELHSFDVPAWIPANQGILLQVRDYSTIVPPSELATHRALRKSLAIPADSRQLTNAHLLFQRLAQQSFLALDELRLPAAHSQLGAATDSPLSSVNTSEHLALLLFRKKNGLPNQRKQYQDIQNVFNYLTGEKCEVRLVSGVSQSASSGQEVEIVVPNRWGDLPLHFSGAGKVEALLLATMLVEGPGRVLLLDEPALHLHPSIQARFLALLEQDEEHGQYDLSLPANQVLLITHSPYLVPNDRLTRVSRFSVGGEAKGTVRSTFSGSLLPEPKLNRFLNENPPAKALLFSQAVILVEGETEREALPVWYPDLLNRDIFVLSVDGKTNFVLWVALLQQLFIPWAILGDGDLLWNNSKDPVSQIRKILEVAGRTLPAPPEGVGKDPQAFQSWSQQLESFGVFTLARQADQGFEKALSDDIPMNIRTEAAQFSSKVARGRFLAKNSKCLEIVHQVLERIMKYFETWSACKS